MIDSPNPPAAPPGRRRRPTAPPPGVEEATPSAPAPREKFAALFALCPVPLALVCYAEGRIQEVNDAFCRQIGRSREEVVGRRDEEVGLGLRPGERERLVRSFADHGHVEGLQVGLVTGSGEERILELAGERLEVDGRDCLLLVGRDITEEQRLNRRLLEQATRDPLTGLPNRQRCQEALQVALDRSRAEGGMTAVLFLDLDRMKTINDTLGHRTGDELLVGAARRLREALRPEDLLARFGGDELVVVARVDQRATALEVAERLRSQLSEPPDREGTGLKITASIGVAVVGPEDDVGPMDLLRFADVAMYQVKRHGGDGVAMFDAERDGGVLRERDTEIALHRSLEQGELELHYQPIVRLDDLGLWGAEALLRWKHPEQGWIPPSQFVPVAEATGMIVPIGRWVLREACRQLALWRREGRVRDDFVVSINVSARQLATGQFVDQVRRVLRRTEVPARCLQVELTERVALDAPEEALALRELGVRLSIDDFGDGYGSLSYLRKVPVETLKVERSFTQDLPADDVSLRLVRTILYLAEEFDQEVIAEGIETPEQLRCLRELGCSLGQGFLFAEALRPEQLGEMAGVAQHQPETRRRRWRLLSGRAAC